MKNSILSTVVFFGLLILNPTMHAQKAQIINGGNPRPSTATTVSSPSTSILPTWVQTVLTVLHLM